MDGETVVRPEKAPGDIEIKLRDLSQLFDGLDPSPFREGSLTMEAEEYFLKKAKALPENQPVRILLRLPADVATQCSPPDIAAALAGHFTARANAESRAIRELFRAGRRAALIGFATLSTCLFLAWQVTENLPARPATRIVQESFVILGWVSVWKPLEMFLYEWLPPHRRRRLFRRLSTADVVVIRA